MVFFMPCLVSVDLMARFIKLLSLIVATLTVLMLCLKHVEGSIEIKSFRDAVMKAIKQASISDLIE